MDNKILPTLYVSITDPFLVPLTEEQVKLRLINKGYIISGNIEDITLLDPSLLKVKHVIRPSVVDEGLPTTYDFDGVYLEDGEAIMYVDTVVDTTQLRHNAVANRTKRNKILEATDWVEVSSAVTTGTKAAYKAYRQLLRDIFTVIDETKYSSLPTAPKIVMKSSKQTNVSAKVVKQLKEYVPKEINGWDIFLQEWSNLEFTPNRLIVTNLIAAYTDTTFSSVSKNL